MAEEAPPEFYARRSTIFGRPSKPTRLQTITAWLLVYGVYFTLYALSFIFVFYGPFADFEITWLGRIFNYLLVGALWGATFVPRRSVRSHLHLVGLKIKKSRRVLSYQHQKFNFKELTFFGPNLGMFLTLFLLAYLTLIFALFWPIVVLLEIVIWSDRSAT